MPKIKVMAGTIVQEVSAVDKPANRRLFLALKGEGGMPKLLEKVIATEIKGDTEMVSVVKSEKGREAMLAAVRLISTFSDEIEISEFAEVAKAAGFELPTPEAPEAPAPEKDKEAVIKAEDLPPHLQAIFKASQAEAETAKQERAELRLTLKAQESEKLERDCLDRAEKEFFAAGTPAEIGKVLKSATEAGGEALAQIEAVLKSAHDRVKGSDQFKVLGDGGSDTVGGDAKDQIETLTTERVQKSAEAGNPITEAAAYNAILRERPDLYREMRGL